MGISNKESESLQYNLEEIIEETLGQTFVYKNQRGITGKSDTNVDRSNYNEYIKDSYDEKNPKDYYRFLDALDDIRKKLEELYPNMPRAMSLIIHHYAHQLFDQMWNSSDQKDKLESQKKFVQFLALISEDTNPEVLQENSNKYSRLPKRTIQFIQEKDEVL